MDFSGGYVNPIDLHLHKVSPDITYAHLHDSNITAPDSTVNGKISQMRDIKMIPTPTAAVKNENIIETAPDNFTSNLNHESSAHAEVQFEREIEPEYSRGRAILDAMLE